MATKKVQTIEEQNHEFCKETMVFKQKLELHYLEFGKRLMEIRDGQLYRPYWTTFGDYLMEMKKNEAWASRIITVYETFVLKFQIPEKHLVAAGGWSMLYEVIPVATNKKKALEWVKRAAEHPQYELRAEIREAMGKDVDAAPRDLLSPVKGAIRMERDTKGNWKASVGGGPFDMVASTLPDLIKLIKKEHE